MVLSTSPIKCIWFRSIESNFKFWWSSLMVIQGCHQWPVHTPGASQHKLLFVCFFFNSNFIVFHWYKIYQKLNLKSVEQYAKCTQPFSSPMDYTHITVGYCSASPSCTWDGARNLSFFCLLLTTRRLQGGTVVGYRSTSAALL